MLLRSPITIWGRRLVRQNSVFHPMASMSQSEPQIPRPSASLIIVNARNEVLLVHRNPQARNFGGVHVFPGGNFDRAQDESLALTAIRETFEESGLLLASASPLASSSSASLTLEKARHDIHAQNLNFKTFLATNSLVPDTESLLPFTQWITPANLVRRFQTQFFVVFLPTAPSSGFSSGSKQEHIPKPGKFHKRDAF
jgi:8-oxo-dGTP pyrophosphatase MutT (NUDIX family)